MSGEEPRIHGGIDVEELERHGLVPEQVCDLSANLNPYGPCEPVLWAAQRAELTRYPDPDARRARAAWARLLDVPMSRLAVGPGAAELLWSAVRALVAPGDRVVIAEPTFSEARLACAASGGRVERRFARAEDGYRIELAELLEHARGARLVYLCSPNNPTGQTFGGDELEVFARELAPTLLVLDQSFLSLSERAQELARPLPDNVISVRSLTKDFALPGLRLGLLSARPELVRSIEAARPTWSTSAPALAAIEAAAGQLEFVAASYARLRAERQRLRERLRQLGLTALPSDSVFLLVPAPGGAPQTRAGLLRQGVLVRDGSSFGLPEHVRVAVRTARESERLLGAWGELLAAARPG
jgi:histidinol-phosphate/aromatic aminotransferase/cobyric acid decarboxylase-like protein